MEPYLLFWTAQDFTEAKAICSELVRKRIAACCSILNPCHSIYEWKGQIEETTESKVLIKTMQKHRQEIAEVIKEKAKYEVPELLWVKIDQVEKSYYEWMLKSVP